MTTKFAFADKAMMEVMISASLKAGNYLLQFKPTRLASAKDFVADADLFSESLIRKHLAEQFPEIPLFGEESNETIGQNESQWIVDPVDGTLNYVHRDSHWGVSIAFAQKGRSVAGVIYLPVKKELFWACRGSKAWRAGIDEKGNLSASVLVRANQEKRSGKPLILVEWVKEKNSGQDHRRVVEILSQIDQAGFLYPQVRNASTASLMMVASGQAAGFVHMCPEPFDIAAACLIVEEAGGKVTDFFGNPWSPFAVEKGIVASNGVIHEELLYAISS